jgi:molybdopterin-guanine dinucleotide biosynthesis protein A
MAATGHASTAIVEIAINLRRRLFQLCSLTMIAAAILAGGRARRFGGQDKSRLIVEGRSIIERQVDVLRSVADDVFLVAHDPERFADLQLPVFPDLISGAGAIGGILTALESTTADRVLVVACDMPFLVAGLLSALATLAESGDGAWVVTTRGPEPLLACYRQPARTGISEAIAAGDLRASALGDRLTMRALTEAEVAAFGPVDRLLANLNTPEEHSRVQ